MLKLSRLISFVIISKKDTDNPIVTRRKPIIVYLGGFNKGERRSV